MSIDSHNFLSEIQGLSTLVHSLQNSLYRFDPLLVGHCIRTAEYAMPLGQAVHLSREALRHLFCAALLHDIGKLTLPQSLSTVHEVNRLGDYINPQCSPGEGANLLQPWPILHEAATLIFHHHERWDGRGTPFGVPGVFIPLGARILAICDMFDRLTHPDCTTTTYDIFSSLRILRSFSGTRYDPHLVSIFTNFFNTSFGNTLRQMEGPEASSELQSPEFSPTPRLATKQQFLQQNSTSIGVESDSP